MQIYDDGCLKSNHSFRIYRAKLNIEADNIKADIDWVREMNCPSAIVRTVHYFCITAIVSGLADKLYINNIKAKNITDLLSLIMQQLPMLEHQLIDKNYEQVFSTVDNYGQHVNKMREQGNYSKAHEYSRDKCLSIYSQMLKIERSFAYRDVPKISKK